MNSEQPSGKGVQADILNSASVGAAHTDVTQKSATMTDNCAPRVSNGKDHDLSSGSGSSEQSSMAADHAESSDSDESMAQQSSDSESHEATPKSDATAVNHLGSSLPSGLAKLESDISSGSIKQEQQTGTADQAKLEPVTIKAEADAVSNAPAISAAEAAKTRHTRSRKAAVSKEPEPPVRRRTSVVKDRHREPSEQTDEDFVLGSSRAKPKGKGKTAGSKKQAAAAAASDRNKAANASFPPVMEDSPEPAEEMDVLLGCTKCRYLKGGCGACRDKPALERPKSLRWKPDGLRQQKGIPVAPTFHPTAEEFTDPLAYIEKIKPEGEKAGICCIVPPPGWAPPFALEKGTNGMSAESFRFLIRRQLTSHLCMRLPNTSRRRKAAAAGRYGAGKVSSGANVDGAPLPEDVEENGKEEEVGEFGFHTLDRTHTLKSFASSADWIKSLHFGDPQPTADPGVAAERSSKRRKLGSYTGPEPTVEEIEGEFWRVIEAPDDVVESFYGQDLDSGHHGSGFPLPPFRQRLLEEHLQKQAAARPSKTNKTDSDTGDDSSKRTYTKEETVYSEHAWNINNLPRCKGSVLRYYIGDELITGVMVPWLYVGSCMSAFCWHIEDHALCSINYLHMGAPKVWYGVPANASAALEEAMQDALPDLFEAAPDLMYSLVTMVSPMNLQARGVPVHRLVHQEGSFVITFPNAYHSGFNTGFNCAEAVNFGPPDWLPYGTDIAEKYRRDGKAITLSHDALLVALVSTAEAVKEAADAKQKAALAETTVATDSNPTADVADPDPSKAAPPQASDADADGQTERLLSGQAASSSQAAPLKPKSSGPYAPGTGKRSDLTFLDPMNKADCPPKAIALAAGELVLRIREEKRRREVGGIAAEPALPTKRMCGGKPGAVDENGVYTDTEDVDCAICKCDMWLYAVVSPACPGKAACTEHANQLGCPRSEQILLYRHTFEELEQLVDGARSVVPGVDAVIAAAVERKVNPPPQVQVNKLGPVNQHLHGSQPPSPSPSPPPAPPKRTRGKDKRPRGPRKKSKRISKDSTPRREVAGSSSRSGRPRANAGKRRKPAQTSEDLPPVVRRPQRKRKAPASADASPVSERPAGTSSRKRARQPAGAVAAPEEAGLAAGKPKRQARPSKKALQAAADHAVAQAVPVNLAQSAQQQQQANTAAGPQHQSSTAAAPQQPHAVAVNPQAALAGNSVTAPVPSHITDQGQAAPHPGQTSPSGSALLLLAQQQMQQRLHQPLPSSTVPQQDDAAVANQQGATSNGQQLRPLGSATAQQALLAQLISHQAAQGLLSYAQDGASHPFFTPGLAAVLAARQIQPGQDAATSAQLLNAQLQHSTAALLLQQSGALQVPTTGMLYPTSLIAPGTILPMAVPEQAAAQAQAQAQAPVQQQQIQQQQQQVASEPMQYAVAQPVGFAQPQHHEQQQQQQSVTEPLQSAVAQPVVLTGQQAASETSQPAVAHLVKLTEQQPALARVAALGSDATQQAQEPAAQQPQQADASQAANGLVEQHQAQLPAEASQQGQDEKHVQTQEEARGHVEFDPDSVLEDKMFESGE